MFPDDGAESSSAYVGCSSSSAYIAVAAAVVDDEPCRTPAPIHLGTPAS